MMPGLRWEPGPAQARAASGRNSERMQRAVARVPIAGVRASDSRRPPTSYDLAGYDR